MNPRTAAWLIIVVGMLGACSGGHGGPRGSSSSTLTIKGSDTMVILTQRWAEAYMSAHDGTTIQVSGGGSGTGIAALGNGTTDIATSSRPLADAERERMPDIHERRVALDAIAIYVHQDSPVRSLTMAQLAAMFRGRVTRWSQVGGPDRPIVLYSRENNSGTYAYFKEHVLEDLDFAPEAQMLAGTAAVLSAVSRDPNGIGYGGIGYGRGVRTLSVAADGDPIEPTMENATSGRYALSRFLFMYTRGEPTGAAGEFLDWVVSEDGQALVDDIGFYPLPQEPLAEASAE
jgi:phosphate transport system substrate-binding protein